MSPRANKKIASISRSDSMSSPKDSGACNMKITISMRLKLPKIDSGRRTQPTGSGPISVHVKPSFEKKQSLSIKSSEPSRQLSQSVKESYSRQRKGETRKKGTANTSRAKVKSSMRPQPQSQTDDAEGARIRASMSKSMPVEPSSGKRPFLPTKASAHSKRLPPCPKSSLPPNLTEDTRAETTTSTSTVKAVKAVKTLATIKSKSLRRSSTYAHNHTRDATSGHSSSKKEHGVTVSRSAKKSGSLSKTNKANALAVRETFGARASNRVSTNANPQPSSELDVEIIEPTSSVESGLVSNIRKKNSLAVMDKSASYKQIEPQQNNHIRQNRHGDYIIISRPVLIAPRPIFAGPCVQRKRCRCNIPENRSKEMRSECCCCCICSSRYRC